MDAKWRVILNRHSTNAMEQSRQPDEHQPTNQRSISRTQTQPRSTRWVYTINNPTPEEVLHCRGLVDDGTCLRVVFGLETGESGTRHIQGCLVLPRRLRLNQLKQILPRAHLEVMRGTIDQAEQYCRKDGEYFTAGDPITLGKRGRRTDLDDVANSVLEGASIRDIAINHPSQYIKFYKGIKELHSIHNTTMESTEYTERRYNRNHDWSKTQIFTGPSNCGKTVYALQILPKALFCTHLDTLTKYNDTDYDGIIFDEFSFKHLPRETQIYLCDQEQQRQLHVRYMCAIIPARTKKIFITNLPVSEVLSLPDVAIERRIQVHKFTTWTEPVVRTPINYPDSDDNDYWRLYDNEHLD